MVTFSLQGMAAAFDRPPLEFAGLFESIDSGYEGAASLTYAPYMFQAAGFYGTMTGPPSYTTAFVYAMLNGPLVTLEFAEITGVVAGFGYNTNIQAPTAADVLTFPLISPPITPTPESNTTPSDIINSLMATSWFFPQDGSFWVAAGLSVFAFEILNVEAVVVVQWDPSIKLGVYGLATAAIPASVDGEAKSFAYVQMGISAVVDYSAGTIKIDGQLTPSSYILDPNCHLTGGFALYSWFGNAQPSMEGDWVYTIGGFSQKFKGPPQYPNPPRLAISWQFNDEICITGQSYFTITPKICMGGGRLDVTLSVGPLSAFLDAYIDFLINFKPFHFIADGGIDVGVKYTLDLWLVTLHVNISISCELEIEGPPIHGKVHVDFWVFDFNIKFGDSSNPYPILTQAEFLELICSLSEPLGEPSPQGSSDNIASDDPNQNGQLHVFSVANGLIPKGAVTSVPSGDSWEVRAATFAFTVACKFPASQTTIATGVLSGTAPASTVVQGTNNSIYAKPMQVTEPITSDVTVTITPKTKPSTDKAQPETHADSKRAVDVPIWNNVSSITKNLPNGLWGVYDSEIDPSEHKNDPGLLDGTTGGTTNYLTGVTLQRPNPALSHDLTYPFNFIRMAVEDVPQVSFPDPVALVPTFEAEATVTSDGSEWSQVASQWTSPNGEVSAIEFVSAWTTIGQGMLGWDAEKVSRKAKDNGLTGQAPTSILLQNIDEYYLWAPMMTAKVVSA
ncbi:hypothetical protein ACHAPI_007539 [Fusarium lateritium]